MFILWVFSMNISTEAKNSKSRCRSLTQLKNVSNNYKGLMLKNLCAIYRGYLNDES